MVVNTDIYQILSKNSLVHSTIFRCFPAIALNEFSSFRAIALLSQKPLNFENFAA